MDDRFVRIQSRIEAVLTHLKAVDDPKSRKTYLLEFRLLLDEADRLHLSPEDHELLAGYWRRFAGDQPSTS
ncbi:MAG TPA: hypothetical protein VFO34_09645 [Candidatus Acidoferrales bacterium]|nr:hypothetical protein [Candidatus Acidoferrales bacterium]